MKILRWVQAEFVVFAFCLSFSSMAGPTEDAKAAYGRGDYATAFRIWVGLAEQGNAEAQSKLGGMYLDGRGVTQDNVAATDWFRKAAEQGFAEAQCDLGFAYSQGRGVIKDETEAVHWYRKAAEQGNARGQDNLGVFYRDGRGVGKDDAEAVAWFRKAAEQGNARGQTNLGFMYANGRGIGKNDAEAVQWYRKAAAQGYALGQNNLGVMYRDGRGVAKDDAVAMELFRKAADQGNTLGLKNLAAMNEPGGGVAKSDAGAVTASPPIPASTGISRSAVLEVGRVTLRISDDGWENIGASRGGRPFTGDRSGDVPFETQHLLLRGKAGEFRAVVTVAASRGGAGGRFTYNTNCQPGTNLYVVDGTGGSFSASDCLRVSGLVQARRFLESAAPDLLANLTGRNVVLPNAAYLVIHEKGINNGAFTFVRVVFAADFKLPIEAGSAGNLPVGIEPEAVAWGLRLAEAVRSSIYSPSGTLLLPPVTAKVN